MSSPRSAMSSPSHASRPSTSSALRYSLLPSNRRTASLGSPNAFFERDGRQTPQTSSPSGLPRHRSKDSISRVLGLPPIPTSAPPRWRRAALAVTAALACAALLAFGTRSTKSRSGGLDENGRIPVGFEAQDVPAEWKCNPFKQAGRLRVDTQNKFNNVWRPYDEDCTASQLFQGMIRGVNKSREIEQAGEYARDGPRRAQDTTLRSPGSSNGIVHYPWLVNATVLLVGDSMERLHLNDFCDLVGGEATNIHPKHIASPPPYHKSLRPIFGADGLETAESKLARRERKQLEDAWEKREHTWNYMRPWMCDVKEYNFTMLFAFAWGMEDMESIFQSEDFYHAPSTWLERFHHIALPLLHNVANHLKRPQVAHPTLIEISSGYWDLRGMTEQDFIAAGYSRPYPKDIDLAFGPIGLSRENKWVKNVRRVIKDVAQTFPGTKGIRDGPPILWRTMHHVKRNNYTPYSRVAALDALARKTMHELRLSSLATYPTSLSALFDPAPYRREARKYLAREKRRRLAAGQDEGDADLLDLDGTDYGFDERLRVDEIGRLLEGQEHHMRDDLHPEALPGSYVWADILLYELKRAYYRVGRTDQHI